jgi:hypothetical protein
MSINFLVKLQLTLDGRTRKLNTANTNDCH